MYAPPMSAVVDQAVLVRQMRQIQIATLVTKVEGEYLVSQTPTIIRQTGALVAVQTHVARANPHWHALREPQASVCLYHGSNAYISPEWYESKKAAGKAVPTWNYIMIEAAGRLRAVDDPQWLRTHVEELSNLNERHRPTPWKIEDAPPDYIDRLLQAIVGLELVVDDLKGAWKLNQHKSAADRLGAIAGLREDSAAPALIEEIERTLSKPAP